MKSYLSVALSMAINVVLCLGIALIFKLELTSVVAFVALWASIVTATNLHNLIDAIQYRRLKDGDN